MSRWSGRSRSTDRAQVEPLAALVAVFAVGAGLSAYVSVLDATLPDATDRNLAEPTAERVERAVEDAGVVVPGSLAAGLRVGPDGHRMNLTLSAAGETWHAGPTPPAERGSGDGDGAGTDIATSAVSVRVGPGLVRPGRLRVEVWT